MRLDDQLMLTAKAIIRFEMTGESGYLYQFHHRSRGPSDYIDNIILETNIHYVKFEDLYIEIKLVWRFTKDCLVLFISNTFT